MSNETSVACSYHHTFAAAASPLCLSKAQVRPVAPIIRLGGAWCSSPPHTCMPTSGARPPPPCALPVSPPTMLSRVFGRICASAGRKGSRAAAGRPYLPFTTPGDAAADDNSGRRRPRVREPVRTSMLGPSGCVHATPRAQGLVTVGVTRISGRPGHCLFTIPIYKLLLSDAHRNLLNLFLSILQGEDV